MVAEVSKGRVCGVGSPWSEVGGLWLAVPSHDLSSDKGERKLLANGSSSAEYVEVEGGGAGGEGHRSLKDELAKNRLAE